MGLAQQELSSWTSGLTGQAFQGQPGDSALTREAQKLPGHPRFYCSPHPPLPTQAGCSHFLLPATPSLQEIFRMMKDTALLASPCRELPSDVGSRAVHSCPQGDLQVPLTSHPYSSLLFLSLPHFLPATPPRLPVPPAFPILLGVHIRKCSWGRMTTIWNVTWGWTGLAPKHLGDFSWGSPAFSAVNN